MRFDKLNEMIPHVSGGKQKILSMHPYNAITLRMPGRHAKDSNGGDFVVCVDDENLGWIEHQFTHADIFADLEAKAKIAPAGAFGIMEEYLKVINGFDPQKSDVADSPEDDVMCSVGIHPRTFLYATQCLAIAEHRRYPQHEAKFGGRYLPFRAAAGIVQGLWSALEASERTRRLGRPGVEWLEKERGIPNLTKELMK